MGRVSRQGDQKSRFPLWQIVFMFGIALWVMTDSPALYVVFLGCAMAMKAKTS